MVETIQWIGNAVVMIDQTRLPLEEKFVTCRTYQEVATAIRDMIIRGAPAIGVAAAMGVALGVLRSDAAHSSEVCDTLAATRPTAVNLFWAIDRMKRLYASLQGEPRDVIRPPHGGRSAASPRRRHRHLPRHRPQRRPLVPDGKTVLTHCNAGALATAGYGTALGVIRAAIEDGKQHRCLRR